MSDILQMPGAWNSAWEEPTTTTYDVVDAYPTVPPPPSSPPSQSHRASPPPPPPPSHSRCPSPPPRRSQNYRAPLPPLSESRRVPPPRPSQSRLESSPPPLQSRSESTPPPWQGASAPTPPPSRRVPLPTTTQSYSEYFPSFWQDRLGTLQPPSQRHRVPLPTQPGSEYEFFADSSDDGNGDTTEVQKKPIVIAVFGKTGAGKTSFIKAVTGKDLKVGHGLTSCTEDVLPVPCHIGNENVILVDTPGFSDTNVTDTEILKRIAEWMKDSYDDGSLLSGIIYLYSISDTRMDGPSLRNLRMMRKLCGTSSLKNVVLATTMWEKVDKNQGLERELELQENFWKDMIDDGSTIARITTETGGEARELVISLLKNKPLSTKLQEELQSGKTLDQTEAGTEIKAEILRLMERLRRDHEADIADLKFAQQSHDLKLARQIRAAMEQSKLKINRLEAEKTELQNLTLKQLPKVKRKGLFGTGGYHCRVCRKKTILTGRWTCKGCGNQQRNMW